MRLTETICAWVLVMGCCHAQSVVPAASAAARKGRWVYTTVPIVGASGTLPKEAQIYLAPLSTTPNEIDRYDYDVSVAPKGMQACSVGKANFHCDARTNRDAIAGGALHPGLKKNDDDHPALHWVSTDPPRLLLTTYDVPEGSGEYQSRQDFIVEFNAGRPAVLLRSELELYGRGGFAALYYGERKLTTRQTPAGLSVRCVDVCTQEDMGESGPLHKRTDWKNSAQFEPYQEKGEYWGAVRLRRTRAWLLGGSKATLQSNTLEYRVQPKDTWTDIASAILKDPARARVLRDLNPTCGKLKAGLWIRLPMKGTDGLTPRNISE